MNIKIKEAGLFILLGLVAACGGGGEGEDILGGERLSTIEVSGQSMTEGNLPPNNVAVFNATNITSVSVQIGVGIPGDASVRNLETGAEICNAPSLPFRCSNLESSEPFDPSVEYEILFANDEFDPVDRNYTVITTNTELLQGQSTTQASLTAGESLVFLANDITGVALVEETGTAELEVRNIQGDTVCDFSTPSDSVCEQRGSVDRLSSGNSYEIALTAVTDSELMLTTLDTSTLSGSIFLGEVSGTIEEGESIFYLVRDITSVTLESITGDADLSVFDLAEGQLCLSENEGTFDRCINIEGGTETSQRTIERYLIQVSGFGASFFTLNPIETTIINQGTIEGLLTSTESDATLLALNISNIVYEPLFGFTVDLRILNLTTGAEVVCPSTEDLTAVVNCSVPSGDYQITLIDGVIDLSVD